MSYVMFIRIRRGMPEVIQSLHFENSDAQAALALAIDLVGTRFWPTTATALRIVNESGQTIIDWTVPTGNIQRLQIDQGSLLKRDVIVTTPSSSMQT